MLHRETESATSSRQFGKKIGKMTRSQLETTSNVVGFDIMFSKWFNVAWSVYFFLFWIFFFYKGAWGCQFIFKKGGGVKSHDTFSIICNFLHLSFRWVTSGEKKHIKLNVTSWPVSIDKVCYICHRVVGVEQELLRLSADQDQT